MNNEQKTNSKTNNTPDNRVYFIDYLRAFVVLAVVWDHSAQGYAYRFGRYWFLPDTERSDLLDIIHIIDFSFMMPFLFFISGFFIMSSLFRHGVWGFVKEKFTRLIIPVIIGLPIIVPLLTYPRYLIKRGGSLGYLDYVRDVFFKYSTSNVDIFGFSIPFIKLTGDFQIALFWFLEYLFLLCIITAIIYKVYPRFFNIFKRFTAWCFEKRSMLAIIIVSLINGAIISLSDIYWGATMWPGFPPVFAVPGAHAIVIIFFFLLGIGVGINGLPKEWFEKISNNLFKITVAMIILSFAYTYYILDYFNESYSLKLQIFLYYGGKWNNAMPIINEIAPYILPRTIMRGFLLTLQSLFLIGVFYKYLNKKSKILMNLAFCSYGIYIFHEPFVVWSHYYMYNTDIEPVFKFIITTIFSISSAWFVTHNIKKIAIIRKVI